ncbi:hypothetical protein BIS44_3565 [Mycobacterium tuberculosis variant bovis BCG]|nr:hypothetical protein BIS44_3565 [Mycobacterium tuberculosis variant bovis BCG]
MEVTAAGARPLGLIGCRRASCGVCGRRAACDDWPHGGMFRGGGSYSTTGVTAKVSPGEFAIGLMVKGHPPASSIERGACWRVADECCAAVWLLAIIAQCGLACTRAVKWSG